MRRVPVLTTGAALLLVTGEVLAQATSNANNYAHGPHMMGWGGGWFGMLLGLLMMILVLAAAVAIAVLLVRGFGGPWQGKAPPHHIQSNRTPLEILKERFARGEIDKGEFEERRGVLGD